MSCSAFSVKMETKMETKTETKPLEFSIYNFYFGFSVFFILILVRFLVTRKLFYGQFGPSRVERMRPTTSNTGVGPIHLEHYNLAAYIIKSLPNAHCPLSQFIKISSPKPQITFLLSHFSTHKLQLRVFIVSIQRPAHVSSPEFAQGKFLNFRRLCIEFSFNRGKNLNL